MLLRAGDDPRPVVEVVHREMDTVELAARHRQVARDARAGGDHDGVVRRAQLLDIDVRAHVDAEPELDALGAQLVDTALDEPLLDLELRHAEAHEPTGRLVALVDDDALPRPCELLRAREPGRARADHGDAPPGARRRGPRDDPALLPRAVHDRELDLLDRDGVALVDLEHARRFARRRAEPAGELREVVRAMELADRLVPAVAVDQVVPVGDQVAERAAAVTERHTALHAARGLRAQLRQRQRADELVEVVDALARVALRRRRPAELLERTELAHYAAASMERCLTPQVSDTGSSRRDLTRPPPRSRCRGSRCRRPTPSAAARACSRAASP